MELNMYSRSEYYCPTASLGSPLPLTQANVEPRQCPAVATVVGPGLPSLGLSEQQSSRAQRSGAELEPLPPPSALCHAVCKSHRRQELVLTASQSLLERCLTFESSLTLSGLKTSSESQIKKRHHAISSIVFIASHFPSLLFSPQPPLGSH